MFNSLCGGGECVFCADGPFTAGLNARTQCSLRGMVHRAHYGAHETLVREGEPRTHFFVLRSGYVKFTSLLTNGRAQITGLRRPGQLVGFAWDDVTYPYTATALTDVEVCQIAHKTALQVLQEKSAVTLRIVHRVAEELAQARAMIRDLGGKNAHERIASFILSLCPSDVEPAEVLPFPLTRQEISELLGLTRETVSRVISEFTQERLIETSHRGVCILAPARLRTLAMGAQPENT